MVYSSEWNPRLPGRMSELSQRVIRSTMLNQRRSVEGNRPPARLDYEIPVMLGNSRKGHVPLSAKGLSKGEFSFIAESFRSAAEFIIVKIHYGFATELYEVTIRIAQVEERRESAPQFCGAIYLCSPEAALSN